MTTSSQRKLQAVLVVSLAAFAALGVTVFERGYTYLSQKSFKPTGPMAKQTRSLNVFSKIESGSVCEVDVKFGSKPSLTFEAPKDLLQHLTADVRGDTLSLGCNTEFFSIPNESKIKAHVVATRLTGAEVSGAGTMVINGQIHEQSFAAGASGAASLTLSANVSTFSLQADGASKVTIGSLTAHKLSLEGSGAAKCTISGKADSATIETSGACNIYAKSFTVNNAAIESSGASNTELHVVRSLAAEASGASNIHYYGKPQVSPSTSGVANISGRD
jgi:hypothetical protein